MRRFLVEATIEYITDPSGATLQDRQLQGSFGVELHNGDQAEVELTRRFERLPANFAISQGIVVPAGGYSYETLAGTYTLGQQRKLSGTLSASQGSFYGGRKTTAGYSGRVGFTTRLAIEPTITLNWVSLPDGDFTARLLGTRVVVAPTARLGVSSLVQYNAAAHTFASSARLRWEYTLGSELFVVYSDGRDTTRAGFPELLNRSFAIKVTRLLRF